MTLNTGEPSVEPVAVVIPAHNAAATIDATLCSVRGQSHAALDIIVVDDGSADTTGEIAAAHAAIDPRVRIVRQANGGVARARNTGWQASTAALVCFIDADDLWTADKVASQLAAWHAAGPGVGLVYSGYVLIDADDVMLGGPPPALHEGDVLDALLLGNFIGNGSGVMISREALLACGGYDPALRDAGAQGCEDILLYRRVAARYRVIPTAGCHVGYRLTPGNMSSNLPRMLRSARMVALEMRASHPGRAACIRRGELLYGIWLLQQAIYGRKPGALIALLAICCTADLRVAAPLVAVKLPRILAGAIGGKLFALLRPDPRPAPTRRFGELGEPEADIRIVNGPEDIDTRGA